MAQPTLPSLPQFNNRPYGSTVGWVPSQTLQREALSASGQGKADTYDMLIQVATIITSAVEGAYDIPVKTIAYSAQAAVEAMKLREARGDDALVKLADRPNPLFASNGIIAGGPCPVTHQYFISRRRKKLAAAATQFFGTLSSLIPMSGHVNIPGTAYHGHASALTAMHLAKLGQLAATGAGRQDLQDWCKLIASVKSAKLAVRAGQLVGSIIPLGSMPSSIAAAVAKTGIKLTTVGACYAAAASIHWAAHVEQGWCVELQNMPAAGRAATQLASATGNPAGRSVPNFSRPLPQPQAGGRAAQGVPNFSRPLPQGYQRPNVPAVPSKTGAVAGPASAIFWEVFTKRGATMALGSYDVAALVREPAGWLALADKLTLI
jgi:hypothetical protein